MQFLNAILEIIFPSKCISCGRHGSDLCISCLSLSPMADRENKEWIYSLYDYRHPPIKKALGSFKYKGKKRLAVVFAEALYNKIAEELSELSVMENFTGVILIPIPLGGKRYRERGYNQVELICKELVKIDNLRQDADGKLNLKLEKNVLIKIKDTEHQARIKDKSKRLKNILNSFAVKNADRIKNRNIILIDDITTTGATLSEARKNLKEARARKVIAFTIAH